MLLIVLVMLLMLKPLLLMALEELQRRPLSLFGLRQIVRRWGCEGYWARRRIPGPGILVLWVLTLWLEAGYWL